MNETDKELVVTAEIPGAVGKDIEVTLRDKLLTKTAEAQKSTRKIEVKGP